jgi:CheY-like chemotaxis protein
VREPARDFGSEAGPRTPVIALAASEPDRAILTAVSCRGPWDVHFASSRVQAWEIVHRFGSPVVLYDRDWPNAEWRTTVHTFASCPQRPCVILMSRVADDYLWQELIRCGGNDLLAKPLRADDVNRALKLASSYWHSGRAAAVR